MSCSHDCSNCSEKDCSERSFLVEPNKYSFIDKIIGVVSGKGGVGKSLVTSLLAVELSRKGYSVGILDADITGPSIPKMFGIKDKALANELGIYPRISDEGIKVMSTNLLLENESDPVVWRGPIIAGTVKQFYTDVVWDKVDFLLVDMPPGTGDVPLTVFQSLPIDAIVVVTSPQELVSMIVEKAVKMANMMDIKIAGVVENMSYFHCPDNGIDYKIFGESHIEEVCKKHNLEVMGRLPIDSTIAKLADNGEIDEIERTYLEDLAKVLEELPLKEKEAN